MSVRFTGAFVDLVPSDIPALNFSRGQWDEEFRMMKEIGIQDVIMIRCGRGRWMAYPSQILRKRAKCLMPYEDNLETLLEIAEKHHMKIWFGTYNSGHDWLRESYDVNAESDLICQVCDEFYVKYGRYSDVFGGWYLAQEICDRQSFRIVECYQKVGRHCRELNPKMPILISPGIRGVKANLPPVITLEEHRDAWDWIFSEIAGVVDIVAFQDGHVHYWELEDFLKINQQLAAKYGLQLWTNSETFDRDLSGGFVPIYWEKLYQKFLAAEHVGITRAITFDFNHFLSPQSIFPAAGNLLAKYCQWAGIHFPA